MPPQEARIHQHLIARAIADHRREMAKMTPAEARILLDAARRRALSAAGASAARASR